MNYRKLGKTDLKVSILGFGGIPISDVGEEEAIAVVNHALDSGVNFIHTSITYGDSATKIGKVMPSRRDDCFLTVKIGGRSEKEAEDTLKRSLKALNTDHIEIAQLPVNTSEFSQVMGQNGAYRAFEKAQKKGVIDFIGITSHDIDFLIKAVSTKAFSNLIMPFNYVARENRGKLISSAKEMEMGIIAMKTLGRGGLPNASQALRYVWNHNVDTAIVGMNKLSEVEENVATANDPRPLKTEEERQLKKIAEDVIKENGLSSSGAVFSQILVRPT